jgi:hypothetical protein
MVDGGWQTLPGHGSAYAVSTVRTASILGRGPRLVRASAGSFGLLASVPPPAGLAPQCPQRPQLVTLQAMHVGAAMSLVTPCCRR